MDMSKLGRESISFERGGDPRRSMRVGKLERLKRKYDHHNLDVMLLRACKAGNLADVKFLVQHGANVKYEFNSPLLWASLTGHLDIVKYLVEHGAQILARDNLALMLATKNGHLDIVKYLIEHGADIHSHVKYNIQVAKESGYKNIVDYLKSKIEDEETS